MVCAESHSLESWGDAEPVRGLVTLTQPVIRPVFDTRSLAECLSAWAGQVTDGRELLRSHWRAAIQPRSAQPNLDFDRYWDQAVHDGWVELEPVATEPSVFDEASVSAAPVEQVAAGGEWTVVLYPKIGLRDGRHAQNPWLHELPDPISKVCWDNYACLSPPAAEELDVSDGDVVRLESVGGEAVELPVLVQPGQHDRVVAVALGYGRLGTDRFTDVGPDWLHARSTVQPGGTVGERSESLVAFAGDERLFHGAVSLAGSRSRRSLARTQTTAALLPAGRRGPVDGTPRPFVQETVLPAYLDDPHAGDPHIHHIDSDLWPEREYSGHHWGLAVDLNACNGCGACVIGCQAENNVPVVGRDEVGRSREMHWMRIDRYYSDSDGDVSTAFEPMMCQQCDNAPCETVCPVLATVHSAEGLNQQVYNRCVGTRYCANNCPYKVRRFNWFNYPHSDANENLVLNPDVGGPYARDHGEVHLLRAAYPRTSRSVAKNNKRRALKLTAKSRRLASKSCPSGGDRLRRS